MSTAATHSVCVFCGSSPGAQPEYLEAANDIGQAIAQTGSWRLVYGGGNRGIMGAVSASCLQAGGKVLGVIPKAMTVATPRGHPTTSSEGAGAVLHNPDDDKLGRAESIVVEDMHTRKRIMAQKSDLGFVALPGGYGTFEEVFEMVTWTQLGIHRKPIVLVNVSDFYEPLRALVEKAVKDEFIRANGLPIISYVNEEDAKREGGWGKATIAAVKKANESLSLAENKGYFDWENETNKHSNGGKAPASLKDTPIGERSVDVQNLTFRFSADHEPALHDCNLALTRGSRCLLIGANGAGKSTILRLLAGKRMPTKDSYMRVFGKDVFHDAPRGITYLGTEWAMNPVVRSDIKVSAFLDSVGGYRHKDRRDQLLDILDVDVNWRMHSISDGERRRVQLTMGLMEPWDLLLLDEVTVDLDVQVRADLLAFLTHETKTRGATIIYATHIFDGLQNFPTQVIHMQHGSITTKEPIAWPPTQHDRDNGNLPVLEASEDDSSILLQTALAWLRQDRQLRMANEEKVGKKTRGAKRGEETDSERFFSKYDYTQSVQR